MFFFFKQKTAYEMRISDWSSDVCSSDLHSASCVAAFEDMESGLHAIVLEMRHERRPRIEPFPRVNARGWHHDDLDHFRVDEERHRVGDGTRRFGTAVPADDHISRRTFRRPCPGSRENGRPGRPPAE